MKTRLSAEQRVQQALDVVEEVAVQQAGVVTGDQHLQPFPRA